MLIFREGMAFLAKNGLVFIDATTAVPSSVFYGAASIDDIVWQHVARTW